MDSVLLLTSSMPLTMSVIFSLCVMMSYINTKCAHSIVDEIISTQEMLKLGGAQKLIVHVGTY